MNNQRKQIDDLLNQQEEAGQLGQDGEELLRSLLSIPTVNEYMNSFSVQLGMAIVNERKKLGLSQQQLAQLVEEVKKEKMAQSTISKVEEGHTDIKGDK